MNKNRQFFIYSDEIKEVDPSVSHMKVINGKHFVYSKVKVMVEVVENREVFISKGKDIIIPLEDKFTIETVRYSYENGINIKKVFNSETDSRSIEKVLKKVLKSEQKLLPYW